MKRIPEPDLMDDIEQAEAYAAADFSEAHDSFVKHFISRFPDFASGSVLDLGCGTADVIIRFAKALPGTKITGIDGARAMLDIGKRDIGHQNLSNRIILNHCFLPLKEPSFPKFDALISNSLLHHLQDPKILWNTVKKCSRSKGYVFIMDLKRPDNTRIAGEIVELYASDAPALLKIDFYNSLLASYTISEIESQLRLSEMQHLSVESVSDRHLIIWGTIDE